MKNFLVLISVVLNLTQISAQGFSGSIEFKYYTQRDTLSNVYYVKDNLVKLDQFTKRTNVVEGSYIFDLKAGKIKAVHAKRKVWSEHKSDIPPIIRGVCEVIEGKNSRQICGIKCKEYIVKNPEENTTVTYFIAEKKFNFFIPMIKLWNRKDKQSVYFNQIKDLPQGSMPLLSEEKQISDGKIITRLEVTKINNKAPDEASLEVPPSYTKFE